MSWISRIIRKLNLNLTSNGYAQLWSPALHERTVARVAAASEAVPASRAPLLPVKYAVIHAVAYELRTIDQHDLRLPTARRTVPGLQFRPLPNGGARSGRVCA